MPRRPTPQLLATAALCVLILLPAAGLVPDGPAAGPGAAGIAPALVPEAGGGPTAAPETGPGPGPGRRARDDRNDRRQKRNRREERQEQREERRDRRAQQRRENRADARATARPGAGRGDDGAGAGTGTGAGAGHRPGGGNPQGPRGTTPEARKSPDRSRDKRPTPTRIPKPTRTPTRPPTRTPTRAPARTATPTAVRTATPTVTATATAPPNGTAAVTVTATATATATASPSPVPSPTATATASPSPTAAPTTTGTPTPAPSRTPTPSPAPSATPTAAPTATPTQTATSTPTATPSPSHTPTSTPTPSHTPTASATATVTATPTATPTPLPLPTIYYCVDGTTTCANPGWARTIQEAISGAITNAIRAVTPVIVVPPALYDERLNLGGRAAVRIVAGPATAGMISFGGRSWAVRKMGAQAATGPVVRPSGGGSVITIEAGSTLILEGFTLEGGTGTAMEIDVFDPATGQLVRRTVNSGAGIVNSGELLLIDSRLAGNDAGQLGSIVYTAPGAVSRIDGGVISGNSGAALVNKGTTRVFSTVIDANAPRGANCMVGNDPGGTLEMTDAAVTASTGTGICNSGALTLTRTAVDRNVQLGLFHANTDQNGTSPLTMQGGSLAGNGGQGIMSWVTNASVASLENVDISGNGVSGVYRLAGTLNVTGGRVSDNLNGGVQNWAGNTCTATAGGSVCTGPDTRLLTMREVDISGNTGAIAVRNNDGARMALVDVEITGNTPGNLTATAIMNGGFGHLPPYLPAELTMTGGRIAGNTGGVSAITAKMATTTLTGVSITNTPVLNGYAALVQTGGVMTMDRVSLDGGSSVAGDCWQRPCTDALLVQPLTTIRDSTFGGAEPMQAVAVPYGTVERSTFTRATLQGGCDLTVRDSTMTNPAGTGQAILGVCYVDGRASAGRLSVSGTTITGGWAGLWNFGTTADISATITGASDGIHHSLGTTAIGPDSRITGNTVGVRNVSSDPGAVTGVSATTVYGNGTNCIGVAGCT